MNVGILLVAHAPLASALRSCALHVFPDAAPDIAALDVASDDPPADICQAIAALRAQWPDQECLVLVDVAGATPCNLARQAPMSSSRCATPAIGTACRGEPAHAAARHQLPPRAHEHPGCKGPSRWHARHAATGPGQRNPSHCLI